VGGSKRGRGLNLLPLHQEVRASDGGFPASKIIPRYRELEPRAWVCANDLTRFRHSGGQTKIRFPNVRLQVAAHPADRRAAGPVGSFAGLFGQARQSSGTPLRPKAVVPIAKPRSEASKLRVSYPKTRLSDMVLVRYALSPSEEWDRRAAGARSSIARGDPAAKPCIP
jgi:hypothetical protein